MAEGRSDLDVLAPEPKQPLAFGGAVEGDGGLVDQRRVVVGVPRLQRVSFAGVGELLTPELADRHQHPEARLLR